MTNAIIMLRSGDKLRIRRNRTLSHSYPNILFYSKRVDFAITFAVATFSDEKKRVRKRASSPGPITAYHDPYCTSKYIIFQVIGTLVAVPSQSRSSLQFFRYSESLPRPFFVFFDFCIESVNRYSLDAQI